MPGYTTREVTLLGSAARTATVATDDQDNEAGHRGVVVIIDVTAVTATPSVVFTIQGKSTLGDDYYTILASAAITATGTTILRVFPGSTVTANTHANDQLPAKWRVNCVHADADSITYSLNAVLLP